MLELAAVGRGAAVSEVMLNKSSRSSSNFDELAACRANELVDPWKDELIGTERLEIEVEGIEKGAARWLAVFTSPGPSISANKSSSSLPLILSFANSAIKRRFHTFDAYLCKVLLNELVKHIYRYISLPQF